jgi:hypothetical protein
MWEASGALWAIPLGKRRPVKLGDALWQQATLTYRQSGKPATKGILGWTHAVRDALRLF